MPCFSQFLAAVLTATLGISCTVPALAQVRLDRADPSITEQALPRAVHPGEATAAIPTVETPTPRIGAADGPTGVVAAITVGGRTQLPSSAFAAALTDYVGRQLGRDDLARLAGAVAGVARGNGYPFASASIEAQPMRNGVLRVTLDDGRVDAVRVIGATNPAADRLLTRALVTGRGVRRAELERAILLVGDIAGVRVKDSRYTRQDGFGILLVTIVQDRGSAYVQLDNRGSREVGPVRSTMLASLRGLAGSGDELSLIAAQTPFDPSEFAFVRGRYAAPVGADGAVLSASASYGRSHPGASLAVLDVIGKSVDLAAAYARPLVRSRARSLWGTLEFRAIQIRQTLSGLLLRDDRLATLTGSLNGATALGGGILRGETSITGGLPLSGVSHEGDARISRRDGDARFATIGYTVEWVLTLARPITLVLGSSGQLASRPVLATAEIGAGGPAFGRGYDYAERTGDNGILGSVELRGDLGRVAPGAIERAQVYAFVDGGHVSNWRHGIGGGSLLSSGAGVRAGLFARLDGMIEIALPLNADRFDTRNRRPRLSVRLSRSF